MDELLQEKRAVAECRRGFPPRAVEDRPELVGTRDTPHSAAAAAGRGLEEHRVSDTLRFGAGALDRRDLFGARNDRHAEPRRGPSCRRLVSEALHARGRRSDERDAPVGARLRERRALGEKSITRMECVGTGLPRDIEDSTRVEIALRGRGRADPDRFVSRARVRRAAIRVGIDRDRRDSHLAQSPANTNRDLAAIRDQDLLEPSHGFQSGRRFSRKAPRPSCPSGELRRAAIVRTAFWIASPRRSARVSRMRRFAVATPRGPLPRMASVTRATAGSSSDAETTSCTRPIAFATGAGKISPVRKYRRAAEAPILGRTKVEITAGAIPRRTSVNPNSAVSAAITTSQQATSPIPPPRQAPFTRAIVGIGSSSRARIMPAKRIASASFSSRVN